tara:strand:- start:463 stop:870 length:408 start_codon:yes stop_codon:yes gene_type:complete
MTEWVKIDRATGEVLKKRTEDKLERVFNKPQVWIELDKKNAPEYDASTHKLNAIVTQPDLSDLSVDVPSSSKRVEDWEAVALSESEIAANKDAQYAQPVSVFFKLAMDQENRIRALESKSALDVAAFQKHLRDAF